MENIVSCKDLTKVYRIENNRLRALDGVSLDIAKGEICCIVGKSGSGKSTLLNLLAGLEHPTKGTIVIKGKRTSSMTENELVIFRQKHVGFIFQSFNLFSYLTALDNVCMPLIFKGVPRNKRRKRARKMLKAVGLATHLKHRPTQLSGGQQQRVSLARALVADPEIIFADEPTGNLDSKTSEEIMELMVSFVRKNEKTLIMVTHDIENAAYADRVIHILDGKIQMIEVNENIREAKDDA